MLDWFRIASDISCHVVFVAQAPHAIDYRLLHTQQILRRTSNSLFPPSPPSNMVQYKICTFIYIKLLSRSLIKRTKPAKYWDYGRRPRMSRRDAKRLSDEDEQTCMSTPQLTSARGPLSLSTLYWISNVFAMSTTLCLDWSSEKKEDRDHITIKLICESLQVKLTSF